jgi:CzcA family heavy metal efflux pump
VSISSSTRNPTDLWELARYDIYPRFLRIPGVSRVNIVGGKVPEYHVLFDPAKVSAYGLSAAKISRALEATNLLIPAGMHEENRQLYLRVIDNRIHDPLRIADVTVGWSGSSPIHIRDVATVRPGEAPQYNVVTADGKLTVLLNVYNQVDGTGNTVAIADALHGEIEQLRGELPPDIKVAFFYDQSLFVRDGVRSVWESILFGLALSIAVLFVFLRSVVSTFVAAAVIPVTVLITLCFMRLFGMSFNLMTLGGIAAAVGLVIDDAIVVVEAIYAKRRAGHSAAQAVQVAIHEVGLPLVGSTLTPVVVFIPLAFLDGVAGVFFRALALTMVFALLTSLVMAVTWTPAIAGLLMRRGGGGASDEMEDGGPVLRRVIALYEIVVRAALRHAVVTLLVMIVVALIGAGLYWRLDSDFLPTMDEGGFVMDYYMRPGTSLAETNRVLRRVERIIGGTREVESFSRRTGARLALALAEPNFGDFLVKLRPRRGRTTSEVVDEVRQKINTTEPALHTSFAGVLGDLITDLTYSPSPVEIKVFSTDTAVLKETAAKIAEQIKALPGLVDVEDGLVVAGPSMRLQIEGDPAARAGLTPRDIGEELQTSLLGSVSSYVLRGDRTYGIRVMSAPGDYLRERSIMAAPLQTADGKRFVVADVAQLDHEPGILEMRREDLRQLVAVNARLSGVDLGHAIAAIKVKLSGMKVPPGTRIEYGGLYQQQQESFRNLTMVLVLAVFLVYAVLLIEFRSILAPVAIMLGSLLALMGSTAALWLTGTSMNIVAFLGLIIGVGIVAKNGILMLDYVDHLRHEGLSTFEALVQSGRRRLRPVLMTSMATFLGLLPLAYGIGAGADMLRPLAIAVLGALVISLVLSLVATPVCYYVLFRLLRLERRTHSVAVPTVLEEQPIGDSP